MSTSKARKIVELYREIEKRDSEIALLRAHLELQQKSYEREIVLEVAAERERIRALVQAVRDANRDAAEDGETFRLLKPGQERAWMALLAGLDGPNVANNRPGWAATEE